MDDTGFAIRCPHCGNWDVCEDRHPREFAVKIEEIGEIMDNFHKASLNDNTDTFLNREKRLFRCSRPRWACPASFEAFIFEDEQKALDSLVSIKEKWAISRDFRLYRADKRRRWDGEYYGIMFGTEPVPRQRDIELEHLLDSELISEIITGMCSEMGGPSNIYSANVLEKVPPNDLYWMPIERYSDERSLIPTRYNIFCHTCRKEVIDELEKEFLTAFKSSIEKKLISSDGETAKALQAKLDTFKKAIDIRTVAIEPEDCLFVNPKTKQPYWDADRKKCAGRKPMCQRSSGNRVIIDLNHCPAFIDMRREKCSCYFSDMRLIDKIIKNKWPSEALTPKPSECPANFIEIGFPIVVHEHLVGVMMIGQMYYNKKNIHNIENFKKTIKVKMGINCLLARQDDSDPEKERERELQEKLEMIRHVLFWQEEGFRKDDNRLRRSPKDRRARFLVDEDDMSYRLKCLEDGTKRIERVAETRYWDLRSRSEQAFRDEIVGYIQHFLIKQQNSNKKIDFFKDPYPDSAKSAPILHVLKRMRQFWAFEGIAYLWRSGQGLDKDMVYLVGYNTNEVTGEEGESFGFPGFHEIGKVKCTKPQEHPVFWLYDPGREEEPASNEVISQLYDRFLDVKPKLEELGLPVDKCVFFLVVPFEGNIYSFVFFSRDENKLSRTNANKSSIVSELCKEFMLRTCTEVVYELCNVRYRQEHP